MDALELAQLDNQDSINELVDRYTPLIWKMANRIKTCDDIEDVFQDGVVGLLSSTRTYQPKEDCKFETYIFTPIRNEMWRGAKRSKIVKRPAKFYTEASRNKARAKAVAFDIELIADNHDDLSELIEVERWKISKTKLMCAVSRLTDRQQTVILMKMKGHTFNQIGKVVRLSSGMVHRVLVSAVKELRKMFGERQDDDYNLTNAFIGAESNPSRGLQLRGGIGG